jgi:hypothetical protein
MRSEIAQSIGDAVLKLAGHVPRSALQASDEPRQRAEAIAQAACKKAAALSAGFSLPPGPWGLATVLPDLLLIWNLQAKMVADIAAVYGRSASLGREHMLWCLFKHTGVQALRDLVVRSGERYLVRKASGAAIQTVARLIGVKLTQHMINKGIARFVPLLGAVGVGIYAWRDTRGVARAAMDLFSRMAVETGEAGDIGGLGELAEDSDPSQPKPGPQPEPTKPTKPTKPRPA